MSERPQAVDICLTLPEHEAMALAQFVKRASHNDYRALACDMDEAYAMQYAAERLGAALAHSGYAPR